MDLMADTDNNATDFDATMVNAANQMYSELPEEERTGSFGNALKYFISLGFFGYGFRKSVNLNARFRTGIQTLGTMFKIVNTGEDKQRFHDALQYHEENRTAIGKIDFEKHFGCPQNQMSCKINQCQNTLKLQTDFQNAIQDARQKLADSVIYNSAKTSSAIIVMQIVKIYFVWKEISAAKNLHNDPMKFKQIELNIDTLQKIIGQLNQALQANNMNQISKISTRAHLKYNQTKTLISNLQLKINGKFERLDMTADRQVLDGISHFASAIGNGLQFHGVYGFASSDAKALAVILVATFSVFTVADIATYHITKKRMKELQQDLSYLDTLNHQLDQLYQAIEEAENLV
ncbi:unnamed protein product [Adineta ricciae]|uniref:Uncharacterized protein n=1 Tax=Adineta ricciae TaxID=249248 RepID=A0A815WIL8_ADIRI|nr:unnamed protein product [Adineta ricciae]CAF1543974.1 unnamed protein product [Adineta ricciae]